MPKKAYSLDYSIERDIDRVVAVKDILDTLEKDPSPAELEQLGSYILYGKDENGYNAVQRGETTDGNRRYSSFKRKDDKVLSLDEILENPLADQQSLRPAQSKQAYTKKKPQIRRPKYDKNGVMIDPGDSEIPGMTQMWDSIDRIEHLIAVLEGKVPADLNLTNTDTSSYRLYQLKHNLIDLRLHQYYLKDSYQPTIHFQSVDHPKQQFIDWSSDSQYWMPLDQWQRKVSKSLLSSVSKNLEDYETRVNPVTNETEVKWVVCHHTFNWEDISHVKALINRYDDIASYFHDRLDAYGKTLVFDFERYREMCGLTPVREYILNCKLKKIPYPEIVENLQILFGLKYNESHICLILQKEIPEKIVAAAAKHRLLLDTPDSERKKCNTCGRKLPRSTYFFARNRNRKDGFSSTCKECEKRKRIEKGGQSVNDRRNKESQMLEMQAR